MFMEKDIWDSLKGFDEKFFMYGEDADLSIRAKKMGYKCVVFPESKLIHYGGASEKIRSDKMVRLFKAKLQLFKMHYSKLFYRYAVFMYKMWAFSRMMVFLLLSALKKEKYKESYMVWNEIWEKRKSWKN